MSIKIENVTKRFGRNLVLDNISLEIDDGDFTTFLAPTGSGKTTLLRIIAGLEKPDSGKIYYDDKDVTQLPVRERDIAMVYQDFVNYPSMTVYENLASPLRVSDKNYSEKEIDKKVKKNAELLNISEILDHYPEEISGGQRQRTSIARALIKDVKYIFLDEPLANLDYKLREELRGQLKETFRDKSGAIIYATADSPDALVLSTHVGFISKGKIVQYDKTNQVYNNPSCVEVAQYFSHPTINIWDSELINIDNKYYLEICEKVKINVDKFKDILENKYYIVGIRAHSISLEQQHEDDIPVHARVELCEVVGSETEMHLIFKDIDLILLMEDIVQYKTGQQIEVFIDPNKFFVFDKETHNLVTKTGGDF